MRPAMSLSALAESLSCQLRHVVGIQTLQLMLFHLQHRDRHLPVTLNLTTYVVNLYMTIQVVNRILEPCTGVTQDPTTAL